MSALLPLLGGLLMARYLADRRAVIGIDVVLYALAAAVLVATADDHGHSTGSGVLLAAVLAPLSVLTVVLGLVWRSRSMSARP
jgi:hypothetical protein